MNFLARLLGPKPMAPYETGEFIHSVSRNVRVNWDGIRSVATELYYALLDGHYDITAWRRHPLHPKTLCDTTINWIFLVDSLNFSFWADPGEEWAVTWRGVEYTGYWALCAVINRALDQGIPMLDPAYYGNLTLYQVKRILKAHRPGKPKEPIDMPMIEERHEIMRKHGKVLMRSANNFAYLIVKSKQSCVTLLKKTLDRFPSFRDTATYNGKKVSFNKRAQILVADIYACYENQGLGHFHDIEELTCFADYRVPQILQFYRAIDYSNTLLVRIKFGDVMKSGDPDETEIRAATIYACEKIKHHVRRLARRDKNYSLEINSVMVDFWLWDRRRALAAQIDDHLPHHKVRSIYY